LIKVMLVVTLVMTTSAVARGQSTAQPVSKEAPSIREQIQEDRAKAKLEEESSSKKRVWDRDANGKRPWDRKENALPKE